ncbi:hypothetical protein R3P38DRAFT_2776960 [Favolaschia claudopus]|uniref:Uncharacterized protein n=1 Tax=Favolaschia claudopus TaxID=2862362 RepID=A0AAW0BPH3_9AGAR
MINKNVTSRHLTRVDAGTCEFFLASSLLAPVAAPPSAGHLRRLRYIAHCTLNPDLTSTSTSPLRLRECKLGTGDNVSGSARSLRSLRIPNKGINFAEISSSQSSQRPLSETEDLFPKFKDLFLDTEYLRDQRAVLLMFRDNSLPYPLPPPGPLPSTIFSRLVPSEIAIDPRSPSHPRRPPVNVRTQKRRVLNTADANGVDGSEREANLKRPWWECGECVGEDDHKHSQSGTSGQPIGTIYRGMVPSSTANERFVGAGAVFREPVAGMDNEGGENGRVDGERGGSDDEKENDVDGGEMQTKR